MRLDLAGLRVLCCATADERRRRYNSRYRVDFPLTADHEAILIAVFPAGEVEHRMMSFGAKQWQQNTILDIQHLSN